MRFRNPAICKEEEPLAATQEPHVVPNRGNLREVGEGRVDGRRGPSGETDETPVDMAADVPRGGRAANAVAELDVAAEEAFEGLGEPLAVEGVGDEAAPGSRDALESLDGSRGDAGEDLHDGVVGETGRRRRGAPPGVGAVIYAAACKTKELEIRGCARALGEMQRA